MVNEIVKATKLKKLSLVFDTYVHIVKFLQAWKSWREGTISNLIDPILRCGSVSETMRCVHINWFAMCSRKCC